MASNSDSFDKEFLFVWERREVWWDLQKKSSHECFHFVGEKRKKSLWNPLKKNKIVDSCMFIVGLSNLEDLIIRIMIRLF